MTAPADPLWVLVDIGNQRWKVAWTGDRNWHDNHVAGLSDFRDLSALPIFDAPRRYWLISSVHRPSMTRLCHHIHTRWPDDGLTVLGSEDFGLVVEVDEPERVGTDRVAAAAAAYELMSAPAAAVVDIGTAVTVDWVTRCGEQGRFRGGAILASPRLAAQALADHTDALPLVAPPAAAVSPIGRNTEAAITAGLYWGLVGSVRELLEQGRQQFGKPHDVFVTGGCGNPLATALGGDARLVPHLVLRGVWRAARRQLGDLPPTG